MTEGGTHCVLAPWGIRCFGTFCHHFLEFMMFQEICKECLVVVFQIHQDHGNTGSFYSVFVTE
jgi:hypothetical protein